MALLHPGAAAPAGIYGDAQRVVVTGGNGKDALTSRNCSFMTT
jgi:hypothetical protein